MKGILRVWTEYGHSRAEDVMVKRTAGRLALVPNRTFATYAGAAVLLGLMFSHTANACMVLKHTLAHGRVYAVDLVDIPCKCS